MKIKEFKIKTHFNSCLSLMRLLNSQYWNNNAQWFYDFIFSILIIGFMGYMYQSMSLTSGLHIRDASQFKNQLVGLILLQIIAPGSFSMPSSIMEIKTSALMKRIGSTPIKPWMFLMSSITFYLVIEIIVAFWMLLWITILFGFQTFHYMEPISKTDGTIDHVIREISGIKLIFGSEDIYRITSVQNGGETPWVKWNTNTNWFGFFISIIYACIISIFLGLMNVSLSKTSTMSSIIGTTLYFSSMFLSGMLFPLKVVTNAGILNAISYVTPFRYVNTLSTVSWLGNDIFNPYSIDNQWLKAEVGISQTDVLISFIIPIIILFICSIITIKFFKWNTR